MGITTLICCGIEALGGFYKGKTSHESFKSFAREFMDPSYKKDIGRLNALQNCFRNGLAHGFCIKQGGIKWKGHYFSEHKKLGLLFNVRELRKDFNTAFLKYIKKLNKANDNEDIKKNFQKRFKEVFILGR